MTVLRTPSALHLFTLAGTCAALLWLTPDSTQAAEAVTLKVAGGNFRGEPIKLDDHQLVLKIGAREQIIPRGLLQDEHLYAVKKAMLDEKDAKGRFELAKWCQSKGLTRQAKKLHEEAMQMDVAFAKESLGAAPAAATMSPPSHANAAPSRTATRSQPEKVDAVPGSSKIDTYINAVLAEQGSRPGRRCNDEVFIRRAYLDLVGVIPNAEAVKQFLGSREPDKREKLIDQLMASERYGMHWAIMWGDLLREHYYSDQQEGTIPGTFRDWIKDALNKNVPYDKFVEELVTSEGLPSENGAVNFYLRDPRERTETVNTISSVFMGTRMSCAQCHDHPFDVWQQKDFHALMSFLEPRTDINMDLVATLVRIDTEENFNAEYRAQIKMYIEQAKAAKGPEKDKKDKPDPKANRRGKGGKDKEDKAGKKGDGMSAMMAATDYRSSRAFVDQLKAAVAKGLGDDAAGRFSQDFYRYRVNRVSERSRGDYRMPDESGRNRGEKVDPYLPWNPDKKVPAGESRRGALVALMRDTPLFAEVHVNRLWARLMGRGLVDPVDDFRKKNPPTHPELLDYLASELRNSKFDTRHVLKLIMLSDAYQRDTVPVRSYKDGEEEPFYERQMLRRMTAEQLYDSIIVATGRQAGVKTKFDGGGMMMMGMGGMMDGGGSGDGSTWAFYEPTPARAGTFLHSFHQPDREQTVVARDDSVSIIQALELFNGRPINDAIRFGSGTLAEKLVNAKLGTGRIVQELFLATLSRMPLNHELSAAAAYLAGGTLKQRVEDLHWALLNTREFMFVR